MADILLDEHGDIWIDESRGDIRLTDSIRQEVKIHLLWLFDEWRLGPSLGFPWFESVLIKNPNIPKIRTRIREEVMSVEGVTSCTITGTSHNRRDRTAVFTFTFTIGEEEYEEEIALCLSTGLPFRAQT